MTEHWEVIERGAEPAGEAPETGEAPADGTAEDEEGAAEAAEPEPEPEPGPQGMSERDFERAVEKLRREAERHAGRVSEIMGEDALELVPCPLCTPNIPGFRFPVVPDDDVREAVREAIGDALGGEYLNASDARICERCNGLGRVITGSHVPEHRLKMCAACNGAGYVMVGGPEQPPASGTAPAVSPPPPTALVTETPSEDPWGRKPGDPDFGRLPQYVTAG